MARTTCLNMEWRHLSPAFCPRHRWRNSIFRATYSQHKVVQMIELLMELGNMGLQLNQSKTKRKLTTTVLDTPLHVEIWKDLVEVLHDACTHKYLGRILTGNLFTRVAGRLNLNLPIVYGWFR